MSESLEVLKKYWGFDSFRKPQDEIIASVLAGHDTFALLPTGAGKSICFQVPTLVTDGLCLVISPLIALMNDQVENLMKRNIKAMALTGELSTDDIITLLDNCVYGNYKFLYMSPERLQQDWVLEKIKNLPLALIAIDEAHCISQWGHDFRPAYLKCNTLKVFFPKVPFIALTATATERVKKDIVENLELNTPNFFQISFARENIKYAVIETEDKFFQIEQLLKNKLEPAIVYVRNRKMCHEISDQLNQLGFKATFYHGGLQKSVKEKNRLKWMKEETPIIVATNAFGMGIDKPNVKTVIHIQIPENLENYYQEAGRVGRDGNQSVAALLYHPSDILTARKQFLNNLPDIDFVKKVYVKLCTYFQIAYGEGLYEQFNLNLNQFCVKYELPVNKTFNSIQFLDRQSILTFKQEYSEKVSIQFLIESKEVIRFISLNSVYEPIIMAILRTYPGIYDMPTAINLALVAKKAACDESKIEEVLTVLNDKEIISYKAKSNDATIIFNEVREDDRTINRVSKHLVAQNKVKQQQLEAVLNYITDTTTCKQKIVLHYFGESYSKNCGNCSVCLSKKATNKMVSSATLILEELRIQPLTSRELLLKTHLNDEEILKTLRELLDSNKIKISSNNKFSIQ
ncbi:RecQ family ATP-dependent DNA helicase [Flavobacterium orientale]|uniref:ATP-dependent DNA helicase RecQ n=1 Tax=Flavobacterium orientale TaxID=1756020 RepID=A0A916Y3W7_9FLAO|nr:ATP-dependent DNA helicase RecQ [Flavobacterium orientale]GGD29799.1 ATP-dependent DNA helicase RecQ2 [Flavobacterium orientale]